MKISIFGLGYVGIVSSVCFADAGHSVIGVDIHPYKAERLAKGESPIIEEGIDDLLKKAIRNNRFRATTDHKKAVEESDVSLICVGTPSRKDGSIDMSYVYNVCARISEAVREKGKGHTVIIRSTVFPGGTKKCLELLNKNLAEGTIKVGFNPEFLREGSAIKDFYSPPYTVIGTCNNIVTEKAKELYSTIDAPFYPVKPEEAELLKYASNAWHAIKINFANEVGRSGKQLGIDSRKVMEMMVADKKLNISKTYLKPGFAYGGSCLPKDIRALNYFAKSKNIRLPMLESLSGSNEEQINHAFHLIEQKNVQQVGLIGLSFKAKTDDLRESPSVILAEKLLGKGFDLKIFDPFINESELIGSNKKFINEWIPHLTHLMVENISDLYDAGRLIVITQDYSKYKKMIAAGKPKNPILDVAGLYRGENPPFDDYEGILW